MKHKSFLFVIAAVFVLIAGILYKHNADYERAQGRMYKYNLDYLRNNVEWTRQYLAASKPLSLEETEEYMWKYNEYAALAANLPSSAAMGMYLDFMHVSFSRMSQEIKSSQPESDVKELRNTALKAAVNLENALDSINKSCGDDALKYYRLNAPQNRVMINVNRDLIDYFNKSNIN